MAIKLIEEKLVQKIKYECRCSFNPDGFQNSTINCENRELIYTTNLEYSNEDGSEIASVIAERIIRQIPFSMVIVGAQLTATSGCTDCDVPATNAASISPSAGVGLFLGGFAAAVLITIIILVTIVYVCNNYFGSSYP